MPGFIYVFNTEARDKLLALEYKLLKSDDASCTYVFVNNGRQDYAFANVSYILSDTLTF